MVCLISRGFYFEGILILVFNLGDLDIKDIFNIDSKKCNKCRIIINKKDRFYINLKTHNLWSILNYHCD